MPFFAVRKVKGGKRGICDDWAHAEQWTAGVSGVIHARFETLEEASESLRQAGWPEVNVRWASTHLNQPLPDDDSDSDDDEKEPAQSGLSFRDRVADTALYLTYRAYRWTMELMVWLFFPAPILNPPKDQADPKHPKEQRERPKEQ